MFRKLLAFIKKDFLIESSYKLSFFLNVCEILASVLVYFFINKLFGQKITPHLNEFGVNYFSYVLLGMAFFSYIGVGLGSFSGRIQAEQSQGTIEALLLSSTKTSTLLSAMALWNLVFATFNLSCYLALGALLFKINFLQLNLLSTLITALLIITSFSSLGILSASFVIVFKRGNPVGWLFNTFEGLIGGVYFPITILPAGLQLLAKFFPITYAIRAIQLSVYQGYSVWQLKEELGFLLAFSIVLLPLSIKVFNYSLTKARKDGSLAKY